jgi:flagellar L-ring protein FlgH
MKPFSSKCAILIAIVVVSSGCTSYLKDVGAEPSLSAPDFNAGLVTPTAVNVSYPATAINPHSTWSDNSSYLFLNKRALEAGDVLTVQIAINDKAQLTNKSNRVRTGSKSLGLAGSFDVAGTGTSGNLDASLRNATDFSGNGGTARSESINLMVAAVVTGVLPNGNLVLAGSQEVRVNAEIRILTIAGIVRPTDISLNNTISYERIAEARVSYGGRGTISEVQKPAYGQQLLDRISPL